MVFTYTAVSQVVCMLSLQAYNYNAQFVSPPLQYLPSLERDYQGPTASQIWVVAYD